MTVVVLDARNTRLVMRFTKAAVVDLRARKWHYVAQRNRRSLRTEPTGGLRGFNSDATHRQRLQAGDCGPRMTWVGAL